MQKLDAPRNNIISIAAEVTWEPRQKSWNFDIDLGERRAAVDEDGHEVFAVAL